VRVKAACRSSALGTVRVSGSRLGLVGFCGLDHGGLEDGPCSRFLDYLVQQHR